MSAGGVRPTIGRLVVAGLGGWRFVHRPTSNSPPSGGRTCGRGLPHHRTGASSSAVSATVRSITRPGATRELSPGNWRSRTMTPEARYERRNCLSTPIVVPGTRTPRASAPGVGRFKRRRSESNRRWRICSPLPYHLATAPYKGEAMPSTGRPQGDPGRCGSKASVAQIG